MTPQQMDFARSEDPVLDRLLQAAGQQKVVGVDLSLDRIQRLLLDMGSPHTKMPPVFHVAGTNGKGSTVAFLRAALEAAGHRVHVFTSPHLVHVNERIRIAGQLVSNADLSEAIVEVLRVSGSKPISFFEVMTAAGMLLFAANPADAVILEVGLGGRLDSTNVIDQPLVTGISTLAMDHVAILGPTMRDIALEKAGIAKKGVPLVTQNYAPAVNAAVAEAAALRGAKLHARGDMWDAAVVDGRLHFRQRHDETVLDLPLPKLQGAHQADNAALAIAMLRAQNHLHVPDSALKSAMGWAQWPARLQRLASGPVVDKLPAGSDLLVDGGHNPQAGKVIAQYLATHTDGLPQHLIIGMLPTKDHEGFLRSFARGSRMTLIPIPGHGCEDPAHLLQIAQNAGMQADQADDVDSALALVQGPSRVLLGGSLHLAGHVLRANGSIPQ